ncbi:MAG: hypothetical protein JST68_22545 [Bacteroidetes bacterium]|nr:hypothetical protein [Bacteroidota bacterium]
MATSYQNQRNDRNQHQPSDIPDCEERDNATQKKINTVKKVYCTNLMTSRDNVKKLEIAYDGKETLYKKKERKFLRTQDNLQRYVNTEISMGSQLMQANKRITINVASYKTWDDNLATALKNIFNTVKDVKAKVADLRDAAVKLENSLNDSCSTSQWCIITGKNPDSCKDDNQSPNPPEGCKDAEEILKLMVCMPKAGLAFDIDSIFKASSDVIGVQKFGNIGSLVPLQTELSTRAVDFDNILTTTIKTRKTDLDNTQKDLVQSLADRTDSIIDLYNQRCDYDGVYKTVSEICCPKCGCVEIGKGHCEPRLDKCLCEICDICGEVRDTFSDLVGKSPAQQPSNA